MTFSVLLLLIGFFILAMIARAVRYKRMCAVCAAVLCTWMILLGARFLGYAADVLPLGILMGASAVGVMYFLSSKLPERYEMLKFPFLISLFWMIYRVLEGTHPPVAEMLTIAGMWVLFGIVYLSYKHNRLIALGKKIIECCKNW